MKKKFDIRLLVIIIIIILSISGCSDKEDGSLIETLPEAEGIYIKNNSGYYLLEKNSYKNGEIKEFEDFINIYATELEDGFDNLILLDKHLNLIEFQIINNENGLYTIEPEQELLGDLLYCFAQVDGGAPFKKLDSWCFRIMDNKSLYEMDR